MKALWKRLPWWKWTFLPVLLLIAWLAVRALISRLTRTDTHLPEPRRPALSPDSAEEAREAIEEEAETAWEEAETQLEEMRREWDEKFGGQA